MKQANFGEIPDTHSDMVDSSYFYEKYKAIERRKRFWNGIDTIEQNAKLIMLVIIAITVAFSVKAELVKLLTALQSAT